MLLCGSLTTAINALNVALQAFVDMMRSRAWKPDPTLFLHAAASFQVDAAACIVIEDSEVGIQAATAAGMPAILYDPFNVHTGFDDIPSISSLLQFLDIL